jgi:hypothetical protein
MSNDTSITSRRSGFGLDLTRDSDADDDVDTTAMQSVFLWAQQVSERHALVQVVLVAPPAETNLETTGRPSVVMPETPSANAIY